MTETIATTTDPNVMRGLLTSADCEPELCIAHTERNFAIRLYPHGSMWLLVRMNDAMAQGAKPTHVTVVRGALDDAIEDVWDAFYWMSDEDDEALTLVKYRYRTCRETDIVIGGGVLA